MNLVGVPCKIIGDRTSHLFKIGEVVVPEVLTYKLFVDEHMYLIRGRYVDGRDLTPLEETNIDLEELV